MRNALRKELMTICGLGVLGSLLLRRPKGAMNFGASMVALGLLKDAPESFAGKSAVVTGGSRGLGLALAEELAHQGAKITILARDDEEMERAKNRLAEINPLSEVHAIHCDVTDDEELEETIAKILADRGAIDLWINNAGAISVGPFETMSREDFEAQLELHFYAVLNATRKLLPHYRGQGGGRFVNICSMGGKIAVPHMLPYDVSKFALAGLSQGLAAELERENITVTTVYPALMRTGSPIQAVFKGDHEKEFGWFASFDSLPGVSQSPAVVAKKILKASLNKRAELIPAFIGKIRMLGGAFFPETMMAIMGLMNRAMPVGKSKVRATGAESRGLFETSMLTAYPQAQAEKAELRWNQTPKDDAGFNLGLKDRPAAFDP